MIGTWAGYYKHDNEIIKKARGFGQTYFTITINTFANNNFEGTVLEDSKSGGMGGTGKIEGKIEGQKVTFKKFMPVRTVLHPDGNKVFLNQKHPTLYYAGTLSNGSNKITGRWKFKIRLGFLYGFIPIPYRPGKGTWQMELQQ